MSVAVRFEEESEQTAVVSIDSPPRRGFGALYLAEALASPGTNLLFIGVYFYTGLRFGWTLRDNFLLMACQGLVYAIGSLLAEPLSRLMDRRRALALLLGLMALCAGAAGFFSKQPKPVVPVVAFLMAYTLWASMVWPTLEGLFSEGTDAKTMSRRIGSYNLIWAGTGVVVIAGAGTLIRYWSPGVFLIPAAVHAIGSAFLWFQELRQRRRKTPAPMALSDLPPQSIHSAGLHPEQALLAQRELAMWLARICLPATACVMYSITSLMPSLTVMQALPMPWKTPLACVWMIGRVAAFGILGATVWWHTRPRVLLISAVTMLVAFVAMCIRLKDVHGLGATPLGVDLIWVCLWELVLGGSVGMIYTGSLYFGMVLSDGATEHGGYHEALIGVGQVLGPALGVLTQAFWPNSVFAGVTAISILLAISLLTAALVGKRRSILDVAADNL